VAQVLTKQPDLSRVPAKARKLLSRCFEKDPKRRLRDIGEVRFLLAEEPHAEMAAPTKAGRRHLPWMLVAAALAGMISLGVAAYRHFNEETNIPQALKLSVVLPDNTAFDDGSIPAISPDARWLAFSATVNGQQGLWVRDLGALATRLLPGSDGARYPFWSPDSRWIGFFTTGGKLKKIEVTGGSAITICDVERGQGGTWNRDDVIVYGVSGGKGLFRVSAIAGSAPVRLSEPDRSARETSHVMPWFLPDGRHFLYTARNFDLEKNPSLRCGSEIAKPHERPPLGHNRKFERHLCATRISALPAWPWNADGPIVRPKQRPDHGRGRSHRRERELLP
jgi:hypothetical protein